MEKITTVKKYKSTGGASLNRAAYELAKEMLDEYDDMWKLAFEEYLYELSNKRVFNTYGTQNEYNKRVGL